MWKVIYHYKEMDRTYSIVFGRLDDMLDSIYRSSADNIKVRFILA